MMKKLALIISFVFVSADPGNSAQTCGCEIENLRTIIEEEINTIFEAKKHELKGDKGEEGIIFQIKNFLNLRYI